MTSDNLDPQEVDKFNKLADKWWDREGEFAPLHQMNPHRVDYIDARCGGLFDKKVLDIGCGGGILSEALSQRQAHVCGIDLAPQSLQVARQHAEESQLFIDYQQITAEAFAEKNAASFDVVCCLEMLEHVPDPESIIQAACKLLKPGGYLFASTLNRSAKSYALAIVAAEHVLRLVPTGTHQWSKFIRPSELVAMIEKQQCRVNNISGIQYNPLFKTFKFNQDPSVNYILCAQKS